MTLLRVVSLVCLSLWFGGLVTLFLSVSAVFAAFADRATAGTAAAAMFARFEVFQMVVGGLLAASSIAVWAITRSKLRLIFLCCVILAGVLAVVSHFGVSARLQAMREARETQSQEFKRLHGVSMMVYVSQTGLLGIGAVVVAVASGQRTRKAANHKG